MRDLDVRVALLSSLAADHAGDADTVIVQEMGIWSGTVRVDVAVINGQLSGFELKSERDTLLRLPTQASLYSKVFDQMALVVAMRHYHKSIELVPDWWSVIGASSSDSGAVILENLRHGFKNPSPDPYLIAQLLWKSEAIDLLDKYDLAGGWRSKPVRLVHERLARELKLDILCEHVRVAIKSRSRARASAEQ